MDFKRAKRFFGKEVGLVVPGNSSSYHRKTTLYPNDFNCLKNKPKQYSILDDLATCFPHGNLRDNVEIYVLCATGLFSVCDGARWKCISKNEDALFHQLLQQKYREDCLAKLGVGKDITGIPNWIQQLVMNEIRPKTANVNVQASADMLDVGIQARSFETTDVKVQASVDTLDFGIQARPVETAEINVQASVDKMDFGIQARPVETAEVNVQASVPDKLDIGIQAQMNDLGVQVDPTQATGAALEAGLELPSNLTLQVHMARNGKVSNLVAGGLDIPIDEDEDSKLILEIIRRNLQKKRKRSEATAETKAIVPAPVLAPVPVPAPAPKLVSPPPGFGPTPCKKNKGDTSMTSIVCYKNQQKVTSSIVTRYHPKLPSLFYTSDLCPKSSPFSQYGYVATDDMPKTMVDVKIPIVPNTDVILKRRGNRQLHILGNGSFGYVYLAIHTKNPLASICVKDFDPNSSSKFDIYQETQTLLYLQSTQFVPKCYGLMDSPINPMLDSFALVQECFAGGCTLKYLIDNPPVTFGKWQWICIVYQLFHGLDMIHNKHVLINDIKTDNVLVDVKKHELSNIRYIDLGLASFRCGHRFNANPEYMAQFLHIAPEVRNGNYSTPASDVYSVGVIVNQIYSAFYIRELEPILYMAMHKNPAKREWCEHIVQKLEKILYL